MKMKKIAAALLVGALAGSVMIANWIPTFASNTVADDNNMITSAAFDEEGGSFDMIEAIKSMTGITEAEKNQLIQTEKDLEGTWKQLDAIEDQINKIYDDIFKDINDRYYAIEDKHAELWDKLYDNIPDGDYEDETSAYIKKSTALTQEEKNLLLDDLAKMDAMNAEYDALQAKADKACADLIKQSDALYEIIDKANEKNQDIWDKVIVPCEPIPYDGNDVIAY